MGARVVAGRIARAMTPDCLLAAPGRCSPVTCPALADLPSRAPLLVSHLVRLPPLCSSAPLTCPHSSSLRCAPRRPPTWASCRGWRSAWTSWWRTWRPRPSPQTQPSERPTSPQSRVRCGHGTGRKASLCACLALGLWGSGALLLWPRHLASLGFYAPAPPHWLVLPPCPRPANYCTPPLPFALCPHLAHSCMPAPPALDAHWP